MLTSLKFTALPFFLSLSLLTGPVCVLAGDTTGADTRSNAGAIPVDRLNEPWWAERHATVLADVKAHPDTKLLMLGDSITNNYVKATPPDENFQPTWKQFYEPRKALNLGFSGDTTANLLWRLDHGEIDGLNPKVAVVLIGTNNTGVAKETAAQTEVGIDAVVVDLERRLPSTKILLLGVLPSAISAEKTAADETVNRYLAHVYGENPRVTYLDVGSIFFDYASGEAKLKSAIFYDPRLSWHPGPLHPDTVGQRMMAEAIEPTLARLMEDQPQVPLESTADINTALIPTERLELDSYDWYARHHAELELQKTLRPKVVMIGDSITNFWGGPPYSNRVNGPMAWQHLFGDTPVLNMGFGWDRVQNVLWRLRQGEFDGLEPDWIVLNIGTNNLTGTANARASSPSEIVDGIEAIRRELLKRSPKSRLVVTGIFPRGPKANDPLRAPILEVNRLLTQRFGTDASVTLLDIGSRFLQTDGSLPVAMMPDGVHPSEAGYEIWAEALRGVFAAKTR